MCCVCCVRVVIVVYCACGVWVCVVRVYMVTAMCCVCVWSVWSPRPSPLHVHTASNQIPEVETAQERGYHSTASQQVKLVCSHENTSLMLCLVSFITIMVLTWATCGFLLQQKSEGGNWACMVLRRRQGTSSLQCLLWRAQSELGLFPIIIAPRLYMQICMYVVWVVGGRAPYSPDSSSCLQRGPTCGW